MIGLTLKLEELQTLVARHGQRAWAHALQLREKLNMNQVRCYRNALNLNVPAE